MSAVAPHVTVITPTTVYECSCGETFPSPKSLGRHLGLNPAHFNVGMSRRVVVTLECGHTYSSLVAADRPSFYRKGDVYRCFECRCDQAVRTVA